MEALWKQKPNGETNEPDSVEQSTDTQTNEARQEIYPKAPGTTGPGKRSNDTYGESSALASDQEKADSDNAKLENAWRGEMNDFGLTGRFKRHVAVLMISWIEQDDDLDTSDEVLELEKVFKEQFNYEVVVKQQLTCNKSPGLQVSNHISEFLLRYDSDQTLIIVYYAGHGIPGNPGELNLAGKRLPNHPRTNRDEVAWHKSEYLIRDAASDVLLIFDCCYAGNLIMPQGRSFNSIRSYECIAACTHKELTSLPGKSSFTSALIWALKILVAENEKFTTQELALKIMKCPDFPDKQYVPVGECNEPCNQRLVLAPLPRDVDPASPISATTNHSNEELRPFYLDLRCWFQTVATENDIKSFAEVLKRNMKDGTISAQQIEWRGWKNIHLVGSEKEIARPIIGWWKSQAQSGRKSATQALFSNGAPVSPRQPLSVTTTFAPHASHSSVADDHSASHEEARNGNGSAEVTVRVTGSDETLGREKTLSISVDSTNKGASYTSRDADMTVTESFESITRGIRGLFSRAVQGVHPMLRGVAMLSLGVCAWYAFPSGPLTAFKIR